MDQLDHSNEVSQNRQQSRILPFTGKIIHIIQFQMKELIKNGTQLDTKIVEQERERVPNQLVDETVDLSETDRGISGTSREPRYPSSDSDRNTRTEPGAV